MADNTVSSMRLLAAETIERSLDFSLSQQENLRALQKARAEALAALSPREREQFDRELSNELAASRVMHLIDASERDEGLYRPENRYFNAARSNSFTLDNVVRDSETFSGRRPEYTEDEKALIGQMLSGRRLSEIRPETVTDKVIDNALELYPLDTVRYVKAVSPEKVRSLAYRAGIHTGCGLNPVDAEQFDVRLAGDEFKRVSQDSYDQYMAGVASAGRSNKIDVEETQKKYLHRPLATEALEKRRHSNAFLAHNSTSNSDMYADLAKADPKPAAQDAVKNQEQESSNENASIPNSASRPSMSDFTSKIEATVARAMERKAHEKASAESIRDQFVQDEIISKIERSMRAKIDNKMGYKLGGDDCSSLSWNITKELSDVLDPRVGEMLKKPKMNAETQIKELRKIAGESYRGLKNCSPEALEASGHKVFMVEIEKKERYPRTEKYKKLGLAGDNIHHIGMLVIGKDGKKRFYENTSSIKEATGRDGVQETITRRNSKTGRRLSSR